MSFEDTIKELKAQIEAEEASAEPEKEEEIQEEPEKKEEEKAPVEEKPAEPVKEAPKEEIDDAGYARLRREAAAERRRAEKLEEELAKLKAPREEVAENAVELPPEINELLEESKISRAEKEFMALEEDFKRKEPGYDDVAQQYINALAQSIKIQNPRMSNTQVVEEAKKTVLRKAGSYLNKGFDPIEELYHEAQELGFRPRAKEEPKKEEEVKEIKPDLAKVAENRKRSAGMAATGGRSEGQITKAAAADLTVAEWRKLSASEKKRLLYS